MSRILNPLLFASKLAERGITMAFSIAKKYNKEKLFNINTEDFEYVSLEDLYKEAEQRITLTNDEMENYADPEDVADEVESTVFQVRGIYINTKGMFDDAPVVALDSAYVNLPAHLTPICKEILADPQAIAAINAGRVGFTIYTYQKPQYHKTCYSVKWVDTQPNPLK